ncbi:hypothetical protein GJU40_17450 [Bacillus lacus]|uniref:MEDS domain-containing protein n=1 Tax=Metabacillus lacus TaxID=1983721 RepID=A0A7X2J1V2_9BACI|nr:MEDS domain-containing protein [Metabacillus lacus]MRX73922.1 hypothetical protein [Metabacillus lacus]
MKQQVLIDDLLQRENKGYGHILYHYTDNDIYLSNVSAFILNGVKKGSHVVWVDKDPNINRLKRDLPGKLSPAEFAKVHIYNNFDFYYSNGNFHPETIRAHLKKTLDQLLDQEAGIYTWGAVEWGDDAEMFSLIEEYEHDLNSFVEEHELISVCAYHAERTPETLKESLMKTHGILMTDKEIVPLNVLK